MHWHIVKLLKVLNCEFSIYNVHTIDRTVLSRVSFLTNPCLILKQFYLSSDQIKEGYRETNFWAVRNWKVAAIMHTEAKNTRGWYYWVSKIDMDTNKNNYKQAQLGVPHSKIQVELKWQLNLQAGTYQILKGKNYMGGHRTEKTYTGRGDTAHT